MTCFDCIRVQFDFFCFQYSAVETMYSVYRLLINIHFYFFTFICVLFLLITEEDLFFNPIFCSSQQTLRLLLNHHNYIYVMILIILYYWNSRYFLIDCHLIHSRFPMKVVRQRSKAMMPHK